MLSFGVEILVIQTKGKEAGSSLFVRIVRIDRTKLVLHINAKLTFTCNSQGSERCQVVTVPHYSNVYVSSGGSITGRACNWDGDKGGVIVLRASVKVLLPLQYTFIRRRLRTILLAD